MDSLLIPLRSNANWFTSADTRASLEARIKAAVVTHDELIFQDGRYTVTVWEDGTLDWIIPAGTLAPEQRRRILHSEPGSRVEFKVKGNAEEEWHNILAGPVIESIEVDFFPILEDAGLRSQHFVRVEEYSISDEGKEAFQRAAAVDRKNRALVETLGVAHFQEKPIVEAVHFDSGLSSQLGCPFVCDSRVGKFITAKNKNVVENIWRMDVRPLILDVIMGVVLPDFSSIDWDQVLRVRESGAGNDLRRELRTTAAELATAAQQVEDPRDLTIIIQKHYLAELSDQLRGETPTVGKMFLNIAANLLPVAGAAASTAADVANLIDHRNSWIALVGKATE